VHLADFTAILSEKRQASASFQRHIGSKNSMDKKAEKRQKGSFF